MIYQVHFLFRLICQTSCQGKRIVKQPHHVNWAGALELTGGRKQCKNLPKIQQKIRQCHWTNSPKGENIKLTRNSLNIVKGTSVWCSCAIHFSCNNPTFSNFQKFPNKEITSPRFLTKTMGKVNKRFSNKKQEFLSGIIGRKNNLFLVDTGNTRIFLHPCSHAPQHCITGLCWCARYALLVLI